MMEVRPPRTPSRLPPETSYGAETQHRPYLYPKPVASLLPNTSPAPFRRKRTFQDYQESTQPMVSTPSAESSSFILHKILIQEELDQLQTVIEAGHVLDESMSADEQHVELEDYTLHPPCPDPYLQSSSEFVVTSRKSVPQVLFEHLNNARQHDPRVKIGSGILPELRRVWFSIGKKLYLWDYAQNTPLYEYSDLSDSVVAATVVPKNRELFTNKVQHMLLVSTLVEVLVFGVVTDPFFNLLPTSFSVATNECISSHFASHPNGRIFLGGSEGKVLEMKYDYAHWYSKTKRFKREMCGPKGLTSRLMSWFVATEVLQLTCDSSRNLLYALTTSYTQYSPYQIDVYDLGPNGDAMREAFHIDAWTFLQRLRGVSDSLVNVPQDRLQIQHISPLPRSLSLDFHLLVVLQNGIRVFISLYEKALTHRFFETNVQSQDEAMGYRPTGEYEITVKFPPISIDLQTAIPVPITGRPVTTGTTSDKPSDYDQMLLLDDGTLVMLEHTVNECRLVTIRRSLSRIAHLQSIGDSHFPEPDETVCCVEEFRQTQIQSLASVPASCILEKSVSELCGLLPRSVYSPLSHIHWLNESNFSVHCLPSLSTSLYLPPAQFQVLTSNEWVEFSELRPVDLLYNVLNQEGAKETERIRELCGRFGVVQICSLLLSIALSPASLLTQVSPMLYQSELAQDRLRSRSKALFRQIANSKVEKEEQLLIPSTQQGVTGDSLLALPENQALSLYLSRTLRPIWAETIAYTDTDTRGIVEHFQASHFSALKARLEPFLQFLDAQYADSLVELKRTKVLRPADRVRGRDPVIQMYVLTTRCLQAIDLLLILSDDHAFRRVANELPILEQDALRTLTFKELIASQHGHLMAKSMVNAYIHQLRNSRAAKSKRLSLEKVLQEVAEKCPSFFTPADAEIYLAEDALARAKTEVDAESKKDFVSSGVQRLMKNAASVYMPRVTLDLLDARQVMTVVSLCIKKAKDLEEIRGSAAIPEMEESYNTIFAILEDVHQCLAVKNPGLVTYLSGLDLDAIARLETEILRECCTALNKELHWALLTWLLRMNLPNKIIQLDSPYVMEFLETQLAVEQYPELSLVADYAMKMNDFKKAYLEYGRLAALRQDQTLTKGLIPLQRRSEYLDLSLVCLESLIKDCKGSKEEVRKLLQEKEALELNQTLCKIQLKVQRDLGGKGGGPEVGLEYEGLDRMLYSAEELYERIAKPRHLFEAQLELLHFIRNNSATQKPDLILAMKSVFIPLIQALREHPWPQKVAEKLEELGKKYPYCFPVDLVCKHCEAINCDKRIESCWLVHLILSLPISCDFYELYTIYGEIWRLNSNNRLDVLLILFSRLELLLGAWAEEAETKVFSATSLWDQSRHVKCSLDLLATNVQGVLQLLGSMEDLVLRQSSHERKKATVQRLRERFELLQGKLRGRTLSRQEGDNPQQAVDPSDPRPNPSLPRTLIPTRMIAFESSMDSPSSRFP